jgi:hypothetical protein
MPDTTNTNSVHLDGYNPDCAKNNFFNSTSAPFTETAQDVTEARREIAAANRAELIRKTYENL